MATQKHIEISLYMKRIEKRSLYVLYMRRRSEITQRYFCLCGEYIQSHLMNKIERRKTNLCSRFWYLLTNWNSQVQITWYNDIFCFASSLYSFLLVFKHSIKNVILQNWNSWWQIIFWILFEFSTDMIEKAEFQTTEQFTLCVCIHLSIW